MTFTKSKQKKMSLWPDLEWVSNVPLLAAAVIGARGVDAEGVEATNGRRTLVDVQAVGVGVAGVALGADALRLARGH